MRIGKTKWVRFNFFPYEIKAIEEYLEGMALKGWKLEKIKRSSFKFKKIEPKVLKYNVDLLDEIAFVDGEGTEKSIEYREYCEMAGWEFVCDREKFQIYCSENVDDIIEIHTDEAERFNIVKKTTIKYEFSIMLVMFASLFYGYIATRNGSFLADNTMLLYVSLIGIRIIIEVIQFLNFIIWKRKAEQSLEKGEKVYYGRQKNSAVKSVILTIVDLLLWLVVISMVIEFGGFVVKLAILYILIGQIPYIIRYFVNKTDGDNINRRNLYRSSIWITMILIIPITLILFYSGIMNFDLKSKNVITGKVNILTIEDLGYEAINKESLYIKEKNSILADCINYRVESNKVYMNYELFTSKYKWAIDYKVNSEFKELKKLDIDYEEIETDFLDEGIKIYTNQYRNAIKIISDNIYLDISFLDEDIRTSDILEKVLDKVFEIKKV